MCLLEKRNLLLITWNHIRGSLNKFPDFFHMGPFIDNTHETLVPFEVISSSCNALVVPFQQLLKGPMEVLLCECVNDLRHSLFHLLNCLITTASELRELPSHREQGLHYREAEELSWCPSWSNSLWQGWSCGLVHCPGGNATDLIWRVLASSDGISFWTPLKPQHSNPNHLANQLWCIDFLTPPTPLIIPHRLPAFLESLMLLKNWCSIHARWSKSSLKYSICFCVIFFSKFKTILLHIILLKCPHVQIAFLKFTSCDNRALVGCIPIPTVAVLLNLKS